MHGVAKKEKDYILIYVLNIARFPRFYTKPKISQILINIFILIFCIKEKIKLNLFSIWF